MYSVGFYLHYELSRRVVSVLTSFIFILYFILFNQKNKTQIAINKKRPPIPIHVSNSYM